MLELRIAAACIVLAGSGVIAGQPAFSGIGFLPGGTVSEAMAVTPDGGKVVGWSNGDMVAWTRAGGIQRLLPDPYPASYALAISADGKTVVGYAAEWDPNDYWWHAARWTEASGVVTIPFAPVSQASGVSGDGTVMTGRGGTNHDYPLRWTSNDGWRVLPGENGEPLNGSGYANAVTPEGRIIVGAARTVSSGLMEPCFWVEMDRPVLLRHDGEPLSGQASAIAPDSSAIVGHAWRPGNGIGAFLWTPGGALSFLEVPRGAAGAQAVAVSATGVVVGFRAQAENLPDGAWLWDALSGGRLLQDYAAQELGLDLTGWSLVEATNISADGRTIVGWGINPQGFREGWVLAVPTPGTMGVCASVFAVARRRRWSISAPGLVSIPPGTPRGRP